MLWEARMTQMSVIPAQAGIYHQHWASAESNGVLGTNVALDSRLRGNDKRKV